MSVSRYFVENAGQQELRQTSKETALQRQVVALREQIKKQCANERVVLMVECGYRMRFFEEDANIAHQVIGIEVSESSAGGWLGASVPTHRTHAHLQRFTAAGYTV